MAKRFSPHLHPRDNNGKFTRNGGGIRKPKKSSGPIARFKANRAAFAASEDAFARSAEGKKAYANTPVAKQPVSKPKVSRTRKTEVGVATAVAGAHAVMGAKSVAKFGAVASLAAGTGHYALASVAAANMATKSALAANEVHRIRTITSTKFKNKSVNEQSKFYAATEKRHKYINRADWAVETAFHATLGGALAGPLIKQQAASRNNKRAGAPRGLSSTPFKNTPVNQGRNGVYKISNVKGRRVQ